LVSYRITHPALENTKALVLDLIRKAQHRVLVEMYLFIDPDLCAAVIEAHKRGIDVRVLLDAKPLPLDLDFHGFPNKRVIHRLLQAGVPTRVYRSNPGQEMHMKLALFDDDSVVVGSTNWTTGSFTSNSESCFHVRSASVHGMFRDIFEYDWAQKSTAAVKLTRGERMVSSMIKIIDWIY
jgi:phosphatidylserine/phosphatidylglycerophosphate/cardiolipin synthase-like enzyme